MNAIASELVRRLAMVLIVFYRATVAIWFGGACRFTPSCSCYAQEAFAKHPPLRAFHLSLRRLLKCHPWGPFGYDPVPELKRPS